MNILYQDTEIVAVDKPTGMLVHRTSIASDVTENFAVQELRDQLGQKVNPVHRIDRPTSGVLLFGLNSEITALLKKRFDEHLIRKTYIAIVRGFCEKSAVIEHPLKKENGSIQDAVTRYETLGHAELPYSTSKFPTSRYSIVKVFPETGRMHQIRRHFAKERNYLLGDTTHGDLKQNKAFSDYTSSEGLMLHALSLEFKHPRNNEQIFIKADLPERFQTCLKHFDLEETDF